jgi:helicase associated protein
VNISDQRWDRAFALLLAFKRREGHTRVPRHHIEKGFRLGQWVAVQRYYQRLHQLPPQRERRLNALGFVWSRRDWLWERGFAALQTFKKREGHCLVHAFHVEDGVHLGNWLTVQRRRKNKMSRERKRRLDDLGFIWWGRVPRKTMRRLRPDKPGTGGRAYPSQWMSASSHKPTSAHRGSRG